MGRSRSWYSIEKIALSSRERLLVGLSSLENKEKQCPNEKLKLTTSGTPPLLIQVARLTCCTLIELFW